MKMLSIITLLIIHNSNAYEMYCGKGIGKIEKMICDDDELKKIDTKFMVMNFALNKSSVSKQHKLETFSWIDKKMSCEDKACLKKVYIDRIAEMELQIDKLKRAGEKIDLNESNAPAKREATYVRIFNGKKDLSTTIKFKEKTKDIIEITGSSVTAQGRTGDFSGEIKNNPNGFEFNKDGCKFKVTSASDNSFNLKEILGSECGGLGVSFDGEYRRE